MAGPIDQLKIFEDYVLSTMTEVEQQFIEVFNEKSGGAISLASRKSQGNFRATNFWKKKQGADTGSGGVFTVEDVKDAGAVQAINLEQDETIEPKFKYRIGPYTWDPGSSAWQGLAPDAAATALGMQLGVEIPLGKLKVGIGAAVSALGKGTAVAGKVTRLSSETSYGTNPSALDKAKRLTIPKLVDAKRIFGDAFGRIGAILMHSTCFFDMIDNNLADYKEVFDYPGMVVRKDPMGTPIIILDNEELVKTASGKKNLYRVLFLQPGAVQLYDSGDYFTNTQTNNLFKHIQVTYQGEGSCQLGLKGYSFSKSVLSPTATELKTPANWTAVASDVKDTAGVVYEVQGGVS